MNRSPSRHRLFRVRSTRVVDAMLRTRLLQDVGSYEALSASYAGDAASAQEASSYNSYYADDDAAANSYSGSYENTGSYEQAAASGASRAHAALASNAAGKSTGGLAHKPATPHGGTGPAQAASNPVAPLPVGPPQHAVRHHHRSGTADLLLPMLLGVLVVCVLYPLWQRRRQLLHFLTTKGEHVWRTARPATLRDRSLGTRHSPRRCATRY